MKAVIRPLISLIFAAGITYGFIVGKIDAVLYLGVGTGTIAFWFYVRSKEKKNGGSGSI